MNPKVIFIDVDGTLINYQNELPESAVRAIRGARENGHRVYISTGRSRAEIYPYIWNIGLDGMIGGNGGYVEDDGEVILHQHLSTDQCTQIVDYLNEHDLDFYLESNSGLFGSPDFEEGAAEAVRSYSKSKDTLSSEMTVREAFPNMIFGEPLYRDDVNKISYVLHDYEDFLRTRERFPDLENGTWGGFGEETLFGDIAVKDINKAKAISALLEHLGADRKNTIAFGDGRIDIPMLEFCETGVAMGNGGEEIKKIADFVTDDVDDDGLYNAFVKLGLIEDKKL